MAADPTEGFQSNPAPRQFSFGKFAAIGVGLGLLIGFVAAFSSSLVLRLIGPGGLGSSIKLTTYFMPVLFSLFSLVLLILGWARSRATIWGKRMLAVGLGMLIGSIIFSALRLISFMTPVKAENLIQPEQARPYIFQHFAVEGTLSEIIRPNDNKGIALLILSEARIGIPPRFMIQTDSPNNLPIEGTKIRCFGQAFLGNNGLIMEAYSISKK